MPATAVLIRFVDTVHEPTRAASSIIPEMPFEFPIFRPGAPCFHGADEYDESQDPEEEKEAIKEQTIQQARAALWHLSARIRRHKLRCRISRTSSAKKIAGPASQLPDHLIVSPVHTARPRAIELFPSLANLPLSLRGPLRGSADEHRCRHRRNVLLLLRHSILCLGPEEGHMEVSARFRRQSPQIVRRIILPLLAPMTSTPSPSPRARARVWSHRR
jgi:hypothetical protein